MINKNTYFSRQERTTTNQSTNILGRLLRIMFYSFTPILITSYIYNVISMYVWSLATVISSLICLLLSVAFIGFAFYDIDKKNVRIGLIITAIIAIMFTLIPMINSFFLFK